MFNSECDSFLMLEKFCIVTFLMQGTKGSHPNASNIGDLFSEGSLNPYADDPYAFD